VAERVVRQDLRLFDRLVERQHEVARNAEDFPGAVLLQAVEQRGRERGHAACGRGARGPGSGGAGVAASSASPIRETSQVAAPANVTQARNVRSSEITRRGSSTQ